MARWVQEYKCICQRGDHVWHSHYQDTHGCARCAKCTGYQPDIPEAVAIRILLGPEMTNKQAADILLGPQ